MPEIKQLKWDVFHPLDHRIGSRYCRSVTNFPDAPKGWRNVIIHARYYREFKLRSDVIQLVAPLWSRTLCRLGYHRPTTWYQLTAWARVEHAGQMLVPPAPGEPEEPETWERHTTCDMCEQEL